MLLRMMEWSARRSTTQIVATTTDLSELVVVPWENLARRAQSLCQSFNRLDHLRAREAHSIESVRNVSAPSNKVLITKQEESHLQASHLNLWTRREVELRKPCWMGALQSRCVGEHWPHVESHTIVATGI